ncbi:MAG: AAA family ATPase [Desulfobacteraceae bacterium]|nr:AAA family ATPase [Desulfobacteraceae bacterium]MBC2749257.1 AAA family ATPase [Desulfobacteraceae bacterium]
MYLEHFGLKAKPFQISADPKFLWMGSKHKEALAILKYGIFDNRGFLLLSGDVGTGKTTLIHALTQDIGSDTVVATVPDPGLSLMDFYRYIAKSFGIKEPFETKQQFLEVFETFLLRNESLNKKVLLIIDEAQRLTSDLLEEIRLLSNIEKDYTKLLNIFFVGQNEFNDIILKQKNRPLRQRITINYNIDPLEQHEVMEYINFRLGVAGCDEPLFTGDAVREVFAFSEGYPRLINIVCDHALLTGFVQGVARITGSIVSECAEELRIHSVTPTPPPPEPAAWPPQAMPAPTVYPTPTPSPEKDRGLSTAQTMLVVIIGILCFVAGLLVFSLRDRPAQPEAATPKETGEAAAVAASVTKEDPPPVAAAVRIPTNEVPAESPVDPSPAPPPLATATTEVRDADPDTAEAPWMKPAPAPPPVTPVVEPTDREAPAVDMALTTETLRVNFQMDSNELTPEGMQDLDRAASLLNARDDIKAKVTGYTDAVGNLHYNLKVSEFRANIVKIYLVGKGVNAERITSLGMGPANPLDSNDTLEGRRRNRRVEIEFETARGQSFPD